LWQSGFQFTVTSGVDSADGREDRAIADRHQGSMATIREAKHASPQKPLNSNKMTKQQLIEQVAAKTELKKVVIYLTQVDTTCSMAGYGGIPTEPEGV
jgi:hypothetical protein